MSNNNEIIETVSSADNLNHHSWAKKYADSYIEEKLKHLSSGQNSSEIRSTLMGFYNIHNDERLIQNVIRNIALSPKVERSYEGDSLADVHVKVKEQYRDKNTPEYY